MRPLALTAMFALLLAGCADEPASAEPSELGEDVEVVVSDTTGAIRGVVVDEAIRPLAGVLVAVSPSPRSVNTTEDGVFTFSSLEPGTYFVSASRFGYSGVQQSVEVVAGDREPPVVKIQLVRDPTQQAYVVSQQFTGFIMCTSSAVALCGAPNVVSNVLLCPAFGVCQGNVTDDRFGWDFYYEANATMIQSEIVWSSTQPLSTQLSLQMETIAGCPEDKYNAYNEHAAGDSPIINAADADEIEEAEIGGTCGIFHSLFSGDSAGTPLGATVQQQYEAYTTAFYGYTPPEGWSFVIDGYTPQPPE